MRFIIIFVILFYTSCRERNTSYRENEIYNSIDSLQESQLLQSDSLYDYWGEKEDEGF